MKEFRVYQCLQICSLLSALYVVSSCFGIILENTRSAGPVDHGDCEYLEFEPASFVTCVCLEGIWAFRVSDIDGMHQWRILGGKETCFHLNEWVTQIQKISNKTIDASIKRIGVSNTFVVVNKEDWEVDSSYDDRGNGPICFPAPLELNSYCLYSLPMGVRIFERSIKKECSTRSFILKEIECQKISFPSSTDSGSPACELMPPIQELLRKKRQAPPAAGQAAQPPPEDEDERTPEDLAKRVGNPDMMGFITDYVVKRVSTLIDDSNRAASGGQKAIRRKQERSTPTQLLLELCNSIGQRLCTPIQPGTFDIAMNAYVMLQTRKFHLKEPYIAFPQFQRILEALERCKAEARALMFVDNTTECASTLPTKVSPAIQSGGMARDIPRLPDYAIAKPGVHEVVVEVVWKTFLMAHSYCFRYFNEYYNDHHTFTIAMIPFFTNKIQDMWLANATGGGSGAAPAPPASGASPAEPFNYTTDQIWYGDLLGNAGILFESVDFCYAASRFGPSYNPSNNYPWFMKRPERDPANEWIDKTLTVTDDQSTRRKKRSIVTTQGTCGVISER